MAGRVTATAATDALYNETAYEGFEEYTSNFNTNLVGASNLTTFANAASGQMKTVYKTYDVEIANSNILTVLAPLDASWVGQTALLMGANINTYNQKNVYGQTTIIDAQGYPNDNTNTKCVVNVDNTQFPYSGYWKGKIQIIVPATSSNMPNLAASSGAPTLAGGTAHTGNNSLQFTGTLTMAQDRLVLQANKNYTFSAWVSCNSSSVYDLNMVSVPTGSQANGVYFNFKDNLGNLISSSPVIIPTGGMVNGWQRVEGEFTPPANTWSVELVVNFPNTSYQYYIDDIRIRPSQALMQSYTYDQTNYRLKAALDDYNYADLYYYDEQGALFLRKKETYKGIKTLKETITHTNIRKN
jgi:hypothetical protein